MDMSNRADRFVRKVFIPTKDGVRETPSPDPAKAKRQQTRIQQARARVLAHRKGI